MILLATVASRCSWGKGFGGGGDDAGSRGGGLPTPRSVWDTAISLSYICANYMGREGRKQVGIRLSSKFALNVSRAWGMRVNDRGTCSSLQDYGAKAAECHASPVGPSGCLRTACCLPRAGCLASNYNAAEK